MPYQWMNHTSGGATVYSCDMSSEIVLGGLTALSTPLNTETQADDGGQTYDRTRSIVSQQPVFSIATKGFANLLEVIRGDGICICADSTDPQNIKYGARVYGQARPTCGENGAKPGANSHLMYEVNWGLLTPVSLAGSRGGDLSLALQLDALTNDDSSVAPFSIKEDAALPGADLAQFTLGSCLIGNIVMDDITDFTLDFGVAIAEKLPALGQIWPRSLSTSKHQPVATITGRNPRILENWVPGQPTGTNRIGWLGNPAEKQDTIFRFRKRKNQGTFEADTDQVHCELQMHGLIVVDNPFDASGAARANTTIRIIGIEDESPNTGAGDTNSPIWFRNGVTYSDFVDTSAAAA